MECGIEALFELATPEDGSPAAQSIPIHRTKKTCPGLTLSEAGW
jgi:hypothetical protein